MVIFDWITKIIIALASLALIFLIILMGYQVWGRYILNDSPTWAENLALLLVLVVVLPVSAVGLRENFHLGITFFVDFLSPRVRRFLDFLTTTSLFMVGALMSWYSFSLVIGTWGRKIPLLGIPQGMRYLPLVICGALIMIFMIEKIILLSRNEEKN
ncbi:TRAP transporter small permease [Nitrincola sp. MINF-07-Sa-05]|uniref:TRAP transporter small permease n=1 Tax=Nitrincola salilacus TaxID=3400273 RepID=UPI003917C531